MVRRLGCALIAAVLGAFLGIAPAAAFQTTGLGKWRNNRYLWAYNPFGQHVPAGARAAADAVAAAATTWQQDRGSVIEMRRLADIGVLRIIHTGPNGIANTAPAAGDFEIIPMGRGYPQSICVSGGAAALAPTTIQAGDDLPDTLGNGNAALTSGDNGVCESTAGAGDTQTLPLGQGRPNVPIIAAGAANGMLATVPAGDDVARVTTPAGDNCRVNNDELNVIGWGRNAEIQGGADAWVAPVDPDVPAAHGAPNAGVIAQAFTFLRFGTNFLREADVCINQFAPFNTGPGGPPAAEFDLEFNVLHEFGHAIGLHHPEQPPAPPRLRRTYVGTVMFETTRRGLRLPALFCDDQSGANLLYPPIPPGVEVPANNVTEARPYGGLVRSIGGCDFGDAPDPFQGAPGNYPSREIEPGERAQLERFRLGGALPGDPNTMTVEPLTGPARHKDPRMEWLGPLSEAALAQPTLPLTPKEPITLAPAAAVAGADGRRTPNNPTSVTFEADSLQPNVDELDDGISFVPVGVGVFDVYAFVNTSGVMNRYVAGDKDHRLYLNGWADWNCNGNFDNPGIAAPPAGTPVDELTLWWTGTPTSDDAFSPNFTGPGAGPGGIAIGRGRLLRFRVQAPVGRLFPCWQRYRLDYAEDVGRNFQTYTDQTLSNMGLNDPGGEATYGEVEDTVFRVDHFGCYETHRPPLNRAGVTLRDQFGASTVTVKRAKRLCAPASKNDEDPTAVTDPPHLTAYTIKQTTRRFRPIRGVTVTNQFGALVVNLVKPDSLLVPTAKSLTATPPALASPIDHYKCYRVAGAGFRRKNVKVETQFGPITVDIKRPRHLCVPVDKNDEGILDPFTHLMCYQVWKPRTATKAFTRNQLGTDEFFVYGARELCVPSQKTLAGNPTPTVTPVVPSPTPTETPQPTTTATPEPTTTATP